MLLIIMILLVALALSVALFLQGAQFGHVPSAQRVREFAQSPNYRDGEFQNIHPTPVNTSDDSYLKMFWDYLTTTRERMEPSKPLPSVKTDLTRLAPDQDVLVWFGHSSYFLQVDGVRILVDPVFSGNASPISWFGKSYPGTDVFTCEEMPRVDYLIITHDHWDHLDYPTALGMRDKVGTVICGLGVGSHFTYWGYESDRVIEKDWNETLELLHGLKIHTTPARHFSGRGILRNKSLWMSYVLETSFGKVYLGGDSGYDTHFKDIGDDFGPIKLALLENGQYDPKWKYSHMFPAEVLQAAKDLRAERLMPVHSGKFTLAEHPWDTPLRDLVSENDGQIPLVTPKIGEVIYLRDSSQVFTHWWEGIDE